MSRGILELRRSPLDGWIAGKVGVARDALSREALEWYQLERLNQTLAWVRQRSAFYRHALASLPDVPLTTLKEVGSLPLTTAADLARDPGMFLCVSQDEIRHVVSLLTSGTGGAAKRLFFTRTDLELALDFFENGVSAVAAAGESMVIALPSGREGSVGAQLAAGIARAGVLPVLSNTCDDPVVLLELVEQSRAAAIIGLPLAMHRLACHAGARGSAAFRHLRSVVLCSDHVASSLVRSLRRHTNAEIFEHYGMTEMGLGGGIDCQAHAGYHMREADFLPEIVDPATGEPLPEGAEGEIVFTTLTRCGMPLIRYRTGDISRLIPEPCPCGSMLRRLARVRDRVDGQFALGSRGVLTQSALDEALFTVEDLTDFAATFTPGSPAHLHVAAVFTHPQDSAEADLRRALESVDAVHSAIGCAALTVTVELCGQLPPAIGLKRRIRLEAAR